MGAIRFYHLTTKPLERALPEILAKTYERGMRTVVKLGSQERVEAMDVMLWTFDPASFIPHGYIRDGNENAQPIWLTIRDDNPNQAVTLILADGATSPHVGDYTLCCEMFDGNDDDAVTAARGRWKEYAAAGHELSYFQQDEQGKWIKK